MSGKGGVDIRAGGEGGISDDDRDNVRRGVGGYEGGSVAGEAGGEATGSGDIRRGGGGYNGDAVGGKAGGGTEEVDSVYKRVEALEKKIARNTGFCRPDFTDCCSLPLYFLI